MASPPQAVTRSSAEARTAPGAPERPAKKQKLKTDERWVMLVSFDEPFRPVLADRTLLEHYNCRSAAMFKHQAPDCEIEGRPAWNFNMSRGLLVAFLKALTHGEFVYPKEVDAHEVVRTFEYEGIAMPGNSIKAPAGQTLTHAAPTLGQRMRREAQGSHLSAYVAQVVHAILGWPRLQQGLDDAERGMDPGFAASGTRVWIAIAPPPNVARWPGGDDTYQLAKKRPGWLNAQLQAVGAVHWNMVQSGALDKAARDEKSFVKLAREGVEIDPMYFYLSCKRDMQQKLRVEHRDAIRHSDQFATWVCNTVTMHGEDAQDKPMPVPVKYARVCIKLVSEMTYMAPNLTRVFGSQCVDPNKVNVPNGKAPVDATPERAALSKALKVHGIKILAWSDQRPDVADALVFPPAYRNATVHPSPYVLLDCGDRAAAREGC